MSRGGGGRGHVLEGEVGEETDGPPQREEEGGLFPRGGPGQDVGGVSDAVDERGEGQQVQRQRRGRRRHKVDERGHGRAEPRPRWANYGAIHMAQHSLAIAARLSQRLPWRQASIVGCLRARCR